MIIYDLSMVDNDTRQLILSSPKYSKWFSEYPKKLLGFENAKTIKGNKKNFRTAILYLLPSDYSGYNVCAMAILANCKKPCLNTSGRGAMGSVQLSRLRKTLYFFQYREKFLEHLKKEINVHTNYCKSRNLNAATRLNGTSDIRWELYLWEFMTKSYYQDKNQFYDYTKLTNRLIPDEDIYDLTFSFSGELGFQKYVQLAVKSKMRIAIVWRYKHQIPGIVSLYGEVLNVDDGDENDLTFLSPKSSVRALYAKGKAINDYDSNFVVDDLNLTLQRLYQLKKVA